MAAQLPDIIVVDHQKLDLYSNPLEQYWIRENKRRPHFHATGSCKRGYVATWEIRNMHLYLKNVEGEVARRYFLFGQKLVKCNLTIISSNAEKSPVKATWFSGKLRIPRGNRLAFEHQGYDSRFEREIIITVDHGHVIKMVTLDNVKQLLTVNALTKPKKPNPVL